MIETIYQKLDKYPKRISKRQKVAFLDFLQNELSDLGYNSNITEGRYVFKCRNLETECSDPEIIIGAHYDTPTILPFYFEYIFRIFGHTRQLLMIISIMIIIAVLTPLLLKIQNFQGFFYLLKSIIYISFLSLLIPNPKNRNDNTSGVASLLEIADRISKNHYMKERVKFIFFDNEELGLLGSLMQRSKMKRLGYPLKNIKFVSIDCVGRGEVAVLAYHNKGNKIVSELNNLFRDIKENSRILRLPFYPLSDNYSFSQSDGVNISWMDKTLIPGGYYIKNVHSPLDYKIDYDKVEKTCDVVAKFIEKNLTVENNA